jgi:hypothetical protein
MEADFEAEQSSWLDGEYGQTGYCMTILKEAIRIIH